MMLLELDQVSVSYGPVHAVRNVSLSVAAGEVLALVGSNGAGKSTLFKSIMGLQPPRSGHIRFENQIVSGLPPSEIVKRGIALSPEGRRVFHQMTVHENLLLGAYLHRDRDGNLRRAAELYDRFPRLQERRTQLAGSLSGGEQQLLAIGRALMARPRLLLLDEPTLGLAPIMVREIAKTIASIRAGGTSVLLVEQNANMALRCCDRALVMENGEIVMSGVGRELLANDHIRNSYLGL